MKGAINLKDKDMESKTAKREYSAILRVHYKKRNINPAL